MIMIIIINIKLYKYNIFIDKSFKTKYYLLKIMENLKTFINNTNEWDLYNGFFLHNDIERLRKF